MIDLISPLILSLSAATSGVVLYKHADKTSEAQRNHLQVICLAMVFIALSPLAQLLLGGTVDSDTLQRLLVNLATYAGLPLIASALIALATEQEWSRAAWGRWLLVLFASFELCRRSGVGDQYSQGLMVVTALTWLIAAILLIRKQHSVLVLFSAFLAGISLVITSPFSLTGQSSAITEQLCLAASLLLLSQSWRAGSSSSNTSTTKNPD